MDIKDKLKTINKLMTSVNKDSTVMSYASQGIKYTFLKTPFPTVDNLIGGIPRGRYTTVCGPEHVGKGAFCMQLIAYNQAQDPNFLAMWTDAESSFDPDWAKAVGVDLDRLILHTYSSEVDTMEALLDSSLSVIKGSKCVDLWVIDSIGALLPKGDVYNSKGEDRSLSEQNMLNLQRKMGEFYRKANIMISPKRDGSYAGCATILIAQIYTVPDAHVSIEAVRGGNAVKHWAHLRLTMRRGPRADWPEPVEIIGYDGVKKKVYPGWAGRIKVDKTRINSNEGKEVLLTFMLGRGFDSRMATIAAAFGMGIFERGGAYYTSDILPEGKVRGKDNLIDLLNKDDDLYNKLLTKVNELSSKTILASEKALDTQEDELI